MIRVFNQQRMDLFVIFHLFVMNEIDDSIVVRFPKERSEQFIGRKSAVEDETGIVRVLFLGAEDLNGGAEVQQLLGRVRAKRAAARAEKAAKDKAKREKAKAEKEGE